MNYSKFKFENDNYTILFTEKKYVCEDGKWNDNPKITREIVASEFFQNYITSIPFFADFGDAASCKAKIEYTPAGKLPTLITTISPDGNTKIIAHFEFISKQNLFKNAGWREKEIIKNAKTFDIEVIDEVKMIHFFTDQVGDISSGIFDTYQNIWKG